MGEWSCHRGGHSWRENGHVTEVITNGVRMVMLQRWKSLMEGEWFCYRGGLFNGEGSVMLERWPV